MGLLSWLLGRRGTRKHRFDPAKVDKVLGKWKPYEGELTLPFSRLPRTLSVPVKLTQGKRPAGECPLSEALFPYWLRIDPSLAGFVAHKIRQDEMYTRVEVPRDGKTPRVLSVPAPLLKFMQRRILERLLNQIDIHEAAHGFRRHRCIFTGAGEHVGRPMVVTMDLRDFFPTITLARVCGMFKAHGFDQKTALLLSALCCHEGRLPQGAPTSPMISNIICRKLDARLAGLMKKSGYGYTRYADDLTFSGDNHIQRLMPAVRQIIEDEGFIVAPEKTAIKRSGSRQTVTGLTVNSKVAVPRKARRILRAMLHKHVHSAEPDPSVTNFLRGHIAFMKSAHPQEAQRMREKLEAAL